MSRWLSNDGVASILTNNIYVLEGGSVDRSRWLELNLRTHSNICCALSELCHPSSVSSLKMVNCPLGPLRYVAEQTGTLQITTEDGFCILKVDELGVDLDFRGKEDVGPTRCRVSREEVRAALKRMAENHGDGRVMAGHP